MPIIRGNLVMSKLKIKFMLVVCRFLKDYYNMNTPSNTVKLSDIDNLLEELVTELGTN